MFGVRLPKVWPWGLVSALPLALAAAGGVYWAFGSPAASGAPPAPEFAQAVEECPRTVPEVGLAPAASGPEVPPGVPNATWFGSNDLWTSVPADGRIVTDRLDDKTFWWSSRFDVSRELQPAITVTARRLDKPGEVSSGPATHGWRQGGRPFMLIGLEFPEYGCWRVQAEYKGHVLHYVVEVSPH